MKKSVELDRSSGSPSGGRDDAAAFRERYGAAPSLAYLHGVTEEDPIP